MTEIQFLIDLLLNYKLPESVKARCISRIGEVESLLNKPIMRMNTKAPDGIPVIQSPSTQALLEKHASEPQPLPIPVARAIDTSTQPIIDMGKGIKGPRKF